MEKGDKPLSSEESIKIIHKMIATAQGSASDNSFYFLFWGWIVVIASLGQYTLEQFTDYPSYMVWLIGIPGWIISFLYGYKQSKSDRPKTYAEDIVMWTWIGFGFSILIVIFGGAYINYQITAMIMLISGLATFITGVAIRFKPLIIGGSSFWIFTPITLALPMTYSPLIMAIAIIVGYLIPGYLLKKQNK